VIASILVGEKGHLVGEREKGVKREKGVRQHILILLKNSPLPGDFCFPWAVRLANSPSMSLPSFDTQATLFGSVASLTPGLFSETDRYKLFAQKVWPVLAAKRSALETCYVATNGRKAFEPVALLGVLIFQFLERAPDRQAADLVRYHLGWKLALNLEVCEQGFHPTTLTTFRDRVTNNQQAKLAFDAVLEALQAEGLVAKRGRQRLDSTHVLGLVARLSKLECVRETLRLALEELAPLLAEAERPDFWAQFWERYVESKLDYQSTESVLKDKQRQAGEDVWRLLQWLEPLPVRLRQARQVELLRRVFGEQYTLETNQSPVPVEKLGAGVVQNPHDPEAQWSAKGRGKARKDWVGYKVQVAESVGPKPEAKQEPPRNFLTSIVTQSAIESDDAGLPASLAAQAQSGLSAPAELYVDGAYVSAAALAQAQAEGRELLGPAQPSASNAPAGYRSEDFEVCVEERRAVCPAGQENTQCSRLEEKQTGKVSYRFEWSSHCHECPLREQCVGAGQAHRSLVVGEHHSSLQARRREQKTQAFGLRMHTRNGIEGTQSELVRAHGLRRARYRGKAKLDLQHQFMGAACNIKRWLRVLAWEVKQALEAAAAGLSGAAMA
jgi:transposase